MALIWRCPSGGECGIGGPGYENVGGAEDVDGRGEVVVPLDSPAESGDTLTATQYLTGTQSSIDLSERVIAGDMPASLPTPQLASSVTACSDHVVLTSTVNGGLVAVRVGGEIAATAVSGGSRTEVSGVNSLGPLAAGDALNYFYRVCWRRSSLRLLEIAP
jgi:hypothetical protein